MASNKEILERMGFNPNNLIADIKQKAEASKKVVQPKPQQPQKSNNAKNPGRGQ